MTNERDIDVLIAKFFAGEADGDEALTLDGWRRSNPVNEQYFRSAEKVFYSIDPRYKPFSINTTEALSKTKFRIKKKSSQSFRLVAATVAILLVACFGWYATQLNQSISDNPSGFAQSVQLNDGSEVEVAAKSKISKSEGFGITNRKVTLEGTATFEVVHDEKLPFLVETGTLFIEDIGTIFTVINEPTSDTIYVIVNEGIVRLYDENGGELIVKAGEKAWYVKSLRTIIADPGTKVIRFDFHDTKLSEVIELIGEAYEMDIILKPANLASCRITTRFYDEDLETILDILSETLSLQFAKEGETYVISGKPCVQ